MDVTAVRGSQLTYCVEVADELLADVEEQTVRSVHQAQRRRKYVDVDAAAAKQEAEASQLGAEVNVTGEYDGNPTGR